MPNLASHIQCLIDEGVRQKDIPEKLSEEPGVVMRCAHIIFGDVYHCAKCLTSLRSVERYIKKYGIRTVRKSNMTVVEKAKAIVLTKLDDPLERWGCRTVKEKLALQSIHVSRCVSAKFEIVTSFIEIISLPVHSGTLLRRFFGTTTLRQAVLGSLGSRTPIQAHSTPLVHMRNGVLMDTRRSCEVWALVSMGHRTSIAALSLACGLAQIPVINACPSRSGFAQSRNMVVCVILATTLDCR